jgi:hypothetical protein
VRNKKPASTWCQRAIASLFLLQIMQMPADTSSEGGNGDDGGVSMGAAWEFKDYNAVERVSTII